MIESDGYCYLDADAFGSEWPQQCADAAAAIDAGLARKRVERINSDRMQVRFPKGGLEYLPAQLRPCGPPFRTTCSRRAAPSLRISCFTTAMRC